MGKETRASRQPDLVIGYGNTLRGDDAVGQRIAVAVARRGLPNVRALAVHQLTPELAEPLAGARRAIFVDAYRAAEGQRIHFQPLELVEAPPPLGHTADPHSLLALAWALYGRNAPAWWLTVPGVQFELHEGLSPTTAIGMEEALVQIAAWLNVDHVRQGRRLER